MCEGVVIGAQHILHLRSPTVACIHPTPISDAALSREETEHHQTWLLTTSQRSNALFRNPILLHSFDLIHPDTSAASSQTATQTHSSIFPSSALSFFAPVQTACLSAIYNITHQTPQQPFHNRSPSRETACISLQQQSIPRQLEHGVPCCLVAVAASTSTVYSARLAHPPPGPQAIQHLFFELRALDILVGSQTLAHRPAHRTAACNSQTSCCSCDSPCCPGEGSRRNRIERRTSHLRQPSEAPIVHKRIDRAENTSGVSHS